MPIFPSMQVSQLSQEEFNAISFHVMEQVFAIHNEFGRFFGEQVYKQELAARLPDVRLEVAIDLVHDCFKKTLFADAIIGSGGLFEFKTVEALNAKHRAQCIQYLKLLGLSHAKLVNLRSEKVQHEFVNCHASLGELRDPQIQEVEWDSHEFGACAFQESLVALSRDWGCGLMVTLYEEALMHLLRIEHLGPTRVPVYGMKGTIATQPMRLAAPNVAFKITAFPKQNSKFISHASRLIQHTPLTAILWANFEFNRITFTTIR